MNCSTCGCELKTDLDQYGPIQQPLCFHCFTIGEEVTEESTQAREEYYRLKGRLEDVNAEIDQLEDEEWHLKCRINELENKFNWKSGTTLIDVSAKFEAWKNAVPLKVIG